MPPANDSLYMARALQLARLGIYSTRPNPTVGCVLVRDGSLIAEGRTLPAGQDHAEVQALAAAGDATGATAYVSLEPCSHHGRTGPCVDALIQAGIARVVFATGDPNPEVSGQGAQRLRAAGVEVLEGVLADEAERINAGFFKRMRLGLPLVRLKLASSLDGRTAMASGESQWITGPAARSDVQKLRGRSAAVVTGVGTVLHDDPALTVRDQDLDIPDQPLRVVLDSRLRTPVGASILEQPGETLLVHAGADENESLRGKAELLSLPDAGRRVDLEALLRELAARHCNDILVECGPSLAGAFLGQGLVDELVLYMAPTLLGSKARPLMELPLDKMAQQRRMQVTDMRKVGDDVRWTLRPGDVESN